MKNESYMTPEEGACKTKYGYGFHKHISWSAIVVGTLVAIGLGFLFDLLNLGIGAAAYKTTGEGMAGLMIGGLIWLIICAIITMFIAGWVTGRFASHECGNCKAGVGVAHGFAMWSLALIITLIMAMHAGSLIPFYTHLPYVGVTQSSVTSDNTAAATNATSTTTTTTSSTDNTAPATNENASTDNAAKAFGMATLSVFLIFLIGAIAACVGAGLATCRKGTCKKTMRPDVNP